MSALAQLRPRGPSPHATARACAPHRRRPALCCAGAEGGGAPAPPAAAPGGARVPAWKAKQAAREAFMAESRAATAAAKEAYRSSSYARPDHAQGGGAPGERARNAAPEGFSTLAALPFVDVLTPEGAWRTRSRRGEVRREASKAHAGCSGTVACARRRLAPQRLAASALLALAANDLGSRLLLWAADLLLTRASRFAPPPTSCSKGRLNDVSPPQGLQGGGASVYAVFDASERLMYVGLSRSIMASLKSHLARTPAETHLFKVQHFARGTTRNALQTLCKAWADEAGGAAGMDGAHAQRAWEGAIDIVALGLEEKDAEAVAATSEGSRERGKALKVAARKVEAMLKDVLKQRGVTESIRYDPKVRPEMASPATALLATLTDRLTDRTKLSPNTCS